MNRWNTGHFYAGEIVLCGMVMIDLIECTTQRVNANIHHEL